MKPPTFVCSQCKKKRRETQRVFEDHDWCQKCVDAESERSQREDSIPGQPYMRTQPPRYMK